MSRSWQRRLSVGRECLLGGKQMSSPVDFDAGHLREVGKRELERWATARERTNIGGCRRVEITEIRTCRSNDLGVASSAFRRAGGSSSSWAGHGQRSNARGARTVGYRYRSISKTGSAEGEAAETSSNSQIGAAAACACASSSTGACRERAGLGYGGDIGAAKNGRR